MHKMQRIIFRTGGLDPLYQEPKKDQMKSIFTVVAILLLSLTTFAQERPLPIIDMHLHANSASSQGPPPLGFCSPAIFPTLDPGKQSWGTVFMESFKNPPCDNPIWSPMTDDEVMNQTLEILERRNIIGVTTRIGHQLTQCVHG